jgi:amidase
MKPFVIAIALVVAVTSLTPSAQTKRASAPAGGKPFTVVEASIGEMRTAMEQGRTTSRELVEQYLMRIGIYEDRLHAAITVNPRALELAAERDRERAEGRVRGPLHGIPIALKDNVHTTDMRTTGGALAFEDLIPPYEATITKNLKDAGAIIIAKTGMTSSPTGWRARRRRCRATTTPSAARASTPTIRGRIRARRPSTAAPRWPPADRAPASARP